MPGATKIKYHAATAKFEQGFEARRQAQQKALVEKQYEQLRTECRAFPQLVDSGALDMQARFPEELRRIRENAPFP